MSQNTGNRERPSASPEAMFNLMWPNSILGGDPLPDLEPIVRRLAAVTWSVLWIPCQYGGIPPEAFAFIQGIARWLHGGSRIIETTPELVKAVLRTNIEGIENLEDNEFMLPGVLFVMPKGTLRSAVRGDCSYLLASISRPWDRTDLSNGIRQPAIWLLSTASSSYEDPESELICEELNLRVEHELLASILRPVPEKLITQDGLVPLNDADFRFVSLHLGFKLLVLLNLYWDRLERLKIIVDDHGVPRRQECRPEFFWRNFNLDSRKVKSWKRGMLLFHRRPIGVAGIEPGVDADWILPSPGPPVPEPEPVVETEPVVKPALGWLDRLERLLDWMR